MKHRIVTAAQMKEIERAGNAHGLPYLQMMENAGLAAYTQLRARLPPGGALLIVCGKGNNGGDGLVMARAAAQDGWRVVVLLAEGDPKTPDAMTNYARLADLPGAIRPGCRCRHRRSHRRRVRSLELCAGACSCQTSRSGLRGRLPRRPHPYRC